jgi:AAA+ ATPase superfamily predicted ATPase
MTFIGRSLELQILEEHYASSKGELFVLYGRRRVGKSELLTRFCQDKNAVYFTASQAETQDNLNQFVAALRQLINDPVLDFTDFRDIEAVLMYLAEKSKEGRLVIVLDEFQYWVMGNKAITSMLQRFWDRVGKSSNLMLVLCGSSISLMVEHVLAEKAPLYGRRTGQLELKPFDYRTAGEFFPDWSPQDKLKAYGVLGGIPAYLAQFDPAITFEENLQRKILRKGTFLSEEASFLLKTELRDTKTYTSILRAVAGGNTTLKDLTTKMNMDARAIATYLGNLQTLHLIQREVSLAERAPEKSRKGRYTIQDNFLNFWFRFVEPNITFLEINQGPQLFSGTIEPQLSTYMGGIFETICQQYVLHFGREVGLPIPRRIGRLWDKDFDIDVVAENADGSYTFGECKWSTSPVDKGVARQLAERAEKSGLHARKTFFVLFSSGGFKCSSTQPAILADPRALYGLTS